MDYEKFKRVFVSRLDEYLGSKDVTIEVKRIKSNDCETEVVCIHSVGNAIVPMVYIKNLFNALKMGCTFEELVFKTAIGMNDFFTTYNINRELSDEEFERAIANYHVEIGCINQ